MINRLIVIAAVLVTASACGQTSMPTTPSPATGGTNVSIVSGARTLTTTAYNPNPIRVSVGGTVMWMNNDSITHTSTLDNGTWDSGTIAPGASFSRTFPTAGTFSYHCSIHPNMIGTVTVQ